MFTGIIRDIGRILKITKGGDWTVAVETGRLNQKALEIGASVSCDGICLTVVRSTAFQFEVQLSLETISKTAALHWKEGGRLNLEPALLMGDALGGHLVSGHIDGTALVKSSAPSGDSREIVFSLPQQFSKFVASKGSVALNGVSLTVNEVRDNDFGVNIIPHTLQQTTLETLNVGNSVNFEVDLIARYTERLLSARLA